MLDEKIELLINGKKFANWFDLEVTLSVDSFDSIGFSAPFEPARKEFRDTFRPFSFAPIQVLLNDDPLFTGTMIDIDPQTSADAKMVSVKCYAFPGVLCDCTAPTNNGYKGRRPKGALKTEFKKGLSLKDIAQQLCDPFDLDCEFRGDVGPKFDRLSIGIEKKIHEFLVPLAKQRGFVITNTEEGKVLFWKTIKQGVPRVDFVEGEPPLTTVRPKFSPQNYHSQITGYSPAKKGKPGGVTTAFNPWLGKLLETTAPINEYRPLSCKFDDTERADAVDSAKAKLGRMFGQMVSWDIEDLPTWRDPDGTLWDPNTSITLIAPGAMVYRQSELLIREVKLRQSTDKLSASLNVVLPGAWSGDVPQNLPWIAD
jgi:prophage tail gpP-like protein